MSCAVSTNIINVNVFYPGEVISARYNQYDKTWKNKISTANERVFSNYTYNAAENAAEAYNVNLLINLQKIKQMEKLENDWNGNGGIAFSSETIRFFMDIICALEKQPQMAPTGRESLQIQYELPDKSYLGFEIFKDKAVMLEVPERDYSKAMTRTENKEIADFINENVRRFYEKE